MSLYYEATDLLQAPTNSGGSLKSRVFSNKNLKAQPAQLYALVIETCKWSPVLKEVIEQAGLLNLERKLSPILSLLLVHDLLLAKKGIALPAAHGLRIATERHKARLQAEFSKARIRRGIGSLEALKEHVEDGREDTSTGMEPPYPRWIRINTLKTQLEDLLETVFLGYERVRTIEAVRGRGPARIYIDGHIPNLIAVPSSIDLTKSEAYTSGNIIFQDKASCFPAYLLDPLSQDGDVIDTCAAPGNKTTHLAAIIASHSIEAEYPTQTIHACEKDKLRAETLQKMVTLAGSGSFTKIHAGQDFLKLDPTADSFKDVGALLLDPSCSGSGMVGRDEMPQLHVPELHLSTTTTSKKPKGKSKAKTEAVESRVEAPKRKRENEDLTEVIVDDDGNTTTIKTEQDLQKRLESLSTFQLSLLQLAFSFPSARKITYSTCSIHAEENECVVQKALSSNIAKERGWRLLQRKDQVRGMRDWPIRGDAKACESQEVADACIRANKGDEHGTMGFFVAGFVRDLTTDADEIAMTVLRDERGMIVRDLLGFPVRAAPNSEPKENSKIQEDGDEEDEWTGFGDERISETIYMPPTLTANASQDENGKPSKKKRRRGVKRR